MIKKNMECNGKGTAPGGEQHYPPWPACWLHRCLVYKYSFYHAVKFYAVFFMCIIQLKWLFEYAYLFHWISSIHFWLCVSPSTHLTFFYISNCRRIHSMYELSLNSVSYWREPWKDRDQGEVAVTYRLATSPQM